MNTTRRSFLMSHRDDASRLVERAKKFSVRIPAVGKVPVPPPDQLAFYGALGILAAVSVIDWPVALAIGAGAAVVAHNADTRPAQPEGANPSASETRVEASAQDAEHGHDKPAPKTVAPKETHGNEAKAKSASA